MATNHMLHENLPRNIIMIHSPICNNVPVYVRQLDSSDGSL